MVSLLPRGLRTASRRGRVGLAAAALSLLAAGPAPAAGGPPDAPDPGWGTNGTVLASLSTGGGAARALLVDRAGRPVLLAQAGTTVGLLRFGPGGALDRSFNPGAEGTDVGGTLNDLAEQPDGRLVAGGAGGGRFLLAEFTAAGERAWVTTDDFGTGEDAVRALALRPDGRIVAVGRAGARAAAAGYTAAGALDGAGFGTRGHTVLDPSLVAAGGVAVAPDGRVLLAGEATGGRLFVAALTPAGAPDPAFPVRYVDPGAGAERVEAFERLADGRLLIAASVSGGTGAVVRLLADGTADPLFGTGGVARLGTAGAQPRDLALQPDGKLVLAGDVAGTDSFLARLRPDGRGDPGFGAGGELRRSLGPAGADGLAGVGVQPDGAIVAAGGARGSILVTRLRGGDSSDPALAMRAEANATLLTFTVSATNRGADPARDVTVAVTPPARIAALGLSGPAGPCAGLVCSLGTIAPGAIARVTLLARARRRGPLGAAATVTSSTYDADLSNNSASVTGTASGRPRLPDLTRPRVRLALRARRLRGLRRGVPLRVTCSERARVRLVVKAARRTLASGRLRFTRRGTRLVRVRLTARGRKRLAATSARRLRLRIVARATDAARNTSTRTLRVALRR